jgi:small subunit ribosomal protein S9
MTKTTAKKTNELEINLSGKYFYGTGKRKTSVARVRLYEKGTGKIIINGASLNDFSIVPVVQETIAFPLKTTGKLTDFDLSIMVDGGGFNSQAEAIRHGISRALVEFDENLRPILKKLGLLTRDARVKERKKYGLKRARKSPQFSKR